MRDVLRIGFEVMPSEASSKLLTDLQSLATAAEVKLEDYSAELVSVETPFRPVISWVPAGSDEALRVPIFHLDDLKRNAKSSMPSQGSHCVTKLTRILTLGAWPSWREQNAYGNDLPMIEPVNRRLIHNEHLGDYYDSHLRADKVGDLLSMVKAGESGFPKVVQQSMVYLEEVTAAVKPADFIDPTVD